MIRFLHTSDWHLGRRLRFLGSDGAIARAHQARYDTVRRLGELAQEREVDFVVVAGDIFDDNAVGRGELALTRDALEAFGEIPVLLLPGNHDPADPSSALRRLAQRFYPQQQASTTVRVLESTDPVEIPGKTSGASTVVHPCPWTRKGVATDLTRALPDREPSDRRVQVALAHGGLLDFSEVGESAAVIDVDSVLAKGFDYLALGDWHGWQPHRDGAAYSGTPEPTRFAEKGPGHAVVVEVDGPGAKPRLEAVKVSTLRWLQEQRTLGSAEDVDALETFLDELPQRSVTALLLSLRGALDLQQRARLDELLQRESEELLYLRLDDRLHLAATAEDLQQLEQLDGFLGHAARELVPAAQLSSVGPGEEEREVGASAEPEARDLDLDSLPEARAELPPAEAAEQALRLLHRLLEAEG
ncbi:MAG: DNA repair exonuclease [Acidobacteriota bacterium]